MKEDIRLSLLLKIVDNAITREINSKVGQLGLTAAQCEVLGFLNMKKEQEVNPIDIEKEFRQQRPTVTGILKRLEEKEFIRFEESSKDKRYKKIITTQRTREHYEQVDQCVKEMEAMLYEGLTEADKKELERLLKIMLKNLYHY